jgi:hypothetical protein
MAAADSIVIAWGGAIKLRSEPPVTVFGCAEILAW